MVERRLVETRSRAQDLIVTGAVLVAGKAVTKPAAPIADSELITLTPTANTHVSRGAIKLIAALDHFNLSPTGRIALDIGASTGGFTEVLLERGARRIYAVDVGRGQLHPRLRNHPHIVSLEAVDARTLTRTIIPVPADCIVADVSFISLTKALGPALTLAGAGAWLVALIKPQFEAGRDAVGKGGIVRDPTDRARAVAIVRDWLATQPHWTCMGVIPSPIHGGDGNEEFLLAARRDD